MCIKDIVKLISDIKLDIEIIEKESGASFGFYNKDNVPTDFLVKEIKNINAQYINGQRLLVIKF